MKNTVKEGDVVRMLPLPEMMQLFDDRQFYDGKFRKTLAESLGGRIGIIEEVQQKMSMTYVLFTPENGTLSSSIPVECVAEIIKSAETNKIEE